MTPAAAAAPGPGWQTVNADWDPNYQPPARPRRRRPGKHVTPRPTGRPTLF
ncbi:hypothetical protein [Haliangium sp.]|uniref:hypothetical protein n=1 Tax=Haliangium sp. TaxID=2663208 RepID=UPI003D11E4A1